MQKGWQYTAYIIDTTVPYLSGHTLVWWISIAHQLIKFCTLQDYRVHRKNDRYKTPKKLSSFIAKQLDPNHVLLLAGFFYTTIITDLWKTHLFPSPRCRHRKCDTIFPHWYILVNVFIIELKWAILASLLILRSVASLNEFIGQIGHKNNFQPICKFHWKKNKAKGL